MAGRLLLRPIFPKTIGGNHSEGQVTSKLFLSHVIAGILVIYGVLFAGEPMGDTFAVGKWTVFTVCVIFGLLSLVFLLISSCRRRNATNVRSTNEDPSINLQLLFLWIFGLANMIFLSVNIAVYVDCLMKTTKDLALNLFLVFANVLYMLFILLQILLLTHNKATQMQLTIYLHFSIVCVLAANFSIWYSSTIYTLFEHKNRTEIRNNYSCFQNSEIEKTLRRKISDVFLPPQLEFCILAATLLISMWQNANKFRRIRSSDTYIELTHFNSESRSRAVSKSPDGAYIVALIIGIFLNVPILTSTVLLDFVYEWKNENVLIILDFSEILCAFSSCVIVYVCWHRIKGYFWYSIRPLTIQEYILIISSMGIMAYFTMGFLAGLSGFTLSKSTIASRVFGMMETFLQTLLLIQSSRYKVQGNGSKLVSVCAMILVITNLSYWFQNSYNRNIITKSRYTGYTDRYLVETILVPLLIFYRFFSGMSAYSIYKRFRLQE